MKPIIKIGSIVVLLLTASCQKEDNQPIITQTIHFDQEWGMFSTYLEIECDFQTLFGEHFDKVDFVTDFRTSGHDTASVLDLSNEDFNYYKGYQIKANQSFDLELEGALCHPENITFTLNGENGPDGEGGWTIVPYIRKTSMSVQVFGEFVGAALVVVKEDHGNIFWPYFNVSTLDSLKPGEAYLVRCSENCAFCYPANE